MVTTIFFTIIIMIPIYGSLIWAYFCPEETLLFGNRWMYKEEPEISNTYIRYIKFASMTAMIGLPIIILSLILEIFVLRLVWVVFPIVFIFGALKIFTDNND
jgi:hypothetical protein